MLNAHKYLPFAAPFLLSAAASAQDAPAPALPTPTPASTSSTASTDEPEREVEIVVTPTRTQRTLSETASSVTVITRRQIEDKKPLDVIDILRLAPGLSISQSGTRGKVASVFLRGSNSNQTLVLIDGVRANSPADERFDVGNLAPENIERIEVLRGPQSALYGADAMGGVINIITRRGSGPLKTGGALEFGSQSSNREVITARGDVGRGSLSFAASRTSTKGFFANDDYRNNAASLRYDRTLSPNSSLTFTGRAEDGEVGAPGQQFLSFDPNARSKPQLLNGTLQFFNQAKSGGAEGTVRRSDRVSLGITHRNLRFDDPINPGAAFPSFTNSILRDQVLVADAQTTFQGARNALSLGGELRREGANGDTRSTYGPTKFDQSTNTSALWAQDELRAGKLLVIPGLRYEHNSQYGGQVSGRLATAYELRDASRIKASAATGFRAPSINELYFPNYGNPNLNPEKSTGFELGYERPTSRGGRAELTAFTTRYRDLIGSLQTGQTFAAANINRARVNGLELSLSQPLTRGLDLIVNHAFLNTSSSSGQLLRRPKFVSTADLLFRRDKVRADLGLVAQGRRFDNDFAAPPFGKGRGAGFYPGFTRLDLTLGYQVQPALEAYVRFGNLLNRRYEEAAGYPSQRFNFVVGLQSRAF